MIRAMDNPLSPRADDHPPRITNEEAVLLSRRLRKYAVYCYLVFGTGAFVLEGFMAFLGLTCSALVVMIGHLWLERILDRLLLPVPQVSPWLLGVHVLTRFTVLVVALAVAIFVARFSPISVILGFSIIVGAIMIEALHALVRSGGMTDRAE